MALAHAQPALAVPVVPGASGSWLMIRWSGAVPLCAAGGWLLYGHDAIAGHGAAAVVVLVAAILSSVAGFAFSALAGALMFRIAQTGVEAIEIMLVASIAIQAYSVWWMRRSIVARNLTPYLAGGLATIPAGVFLLLHTPSWLHAVGLGVFLMLYGGYVLLRPPWRCKRNSLTGQFISGALGGITGATAAFPGAFVTIWCGCHGWEKDQQRAIYQPYILIMQVAVLVALAAVRPSATLRPELLIYSVPALLGASIGPAALWAVELGAFQQGRQRHSPACGHCPHVEGRLSEQRRADQLVHLLTHVWKSQLTADAASRNNDVSRPLVAPSRPLPHCAIPSALGDFANVTRGGLGLGSIR